MQINMDELSDLYVTPPNRLKHPFRFIANGNEFSFSNGSVPTYNEVKIPIQGSSSLYPFDRYYTDIIIEVSDNLYPSDFYASDLDVSLVITESMHGYQVESKLEFAEIGSRTYILVTLISRIYPCIHACTFPDFMTLSLYIYLSRCHSNRSYTP